MSRSALFIVLLGLAVTPDGVAKDFDFCTLPVQTAHASDSDELWTAETVQAQTFEAAISERVTDTPLASYPITYVRMTAARDRERCGGMLSIPERSSRLIGDLLADFMSRWLVKSTSECDLDSAGGRSTGICGAMRRSVNNRSASLASAMDMTAVYLSSHMASALIAVMYDDQFWNQEFPEPTHCERRPCGGGVLAARMAYVRAYKPYYDLNNRFLAKNLQTVMATLKDACHIRGNLAGVGAHLLEQLPLELLFGRIRDTTFAAALTALPAVNPDLHPMLSLVEGRYTGQFHTMREWQLPASLAAAEESARDLIANSLVRSGLGFLGGRGWDDLEFAPPSSDGEKCPFFARQRD